MGYYRGDGGNFYRGDYYKGDPFIGALVGGVIGKAAGRLGAFVGKQLRSRAGQAVTSVVREAAPSTVAGAAGYALGQRQGPSLPALGPLPTLGAGPMRGSTGGKEKRYTKDGKLIRKLNPLNPRALRRALSRAEGFERFAKRTVNAMYRVIDGRKVRTFKKKRRAS